LTPAAIRLTLDRPTSPRIFGPGKQLEFDLRPFAGASGWLILEAQTREGQQTADVFWKQVEIAF
jgi:hypothetical protein